MILSPQIQQFICEHRCDDVRALALQTKKYPDVDLPAAIIQIAGRQASADKIPLWHGIDEIQYPRHLSLEQCSSQATAEYKASLVGGETLADLTGGFGIDCAFLSAKFQRTVYVERQGELCQIATHNFPLLGLPTVDVHNEDGVAYLEKMERVTCIFVDPARRNQQGGKAVDISDCEPNVARLEGLLLTKAERVMIKLSPMLDLTMALKEMPHVQEAHVVAVNNECKELLLLLGSQPTTSIPIHCVNLNSKATQHFVFIREEEQEAPCAYTNQLDAYLYEPNAAVLKAGGFKSIASLYKVKKLHPNSHLYTAAQEVAGFPGRTFRVMGCCTFNKKEMKSALADVEKANITVRNFPASVAELRKRTKLQEGGDTYLFATTLYNESKVLIRCQKV